MTRSQRREAARPIIARVLAETKGQSEEAVSEALGKACPVFWRFGSSYTAYIEEATAQLRELRRYQEWTAGGDKGHTQQEEENRG